MIFFSLLVMAITSFYGLFLCVKCGNVGARGCGCMGLFDFFKNKSAGVEKQYTENGNAYWVTKPISAEEYEEKRNAEIAWLESHYDLTSARGIMSIPE